MVDYVEQHLPLTLVEAQLLGPGYQRIAAHHRPAYGLDPHELARQPLAEVLQPPRQVPLGLPHLLDGIVVLLAFGVVEL